VGSGCFVHNCLSLPLPWRHSGDARAQPLRELARGTRRYLELGYCTDTAEHYWDGGYVGAGSSSFAAVARHFYVGAGVPHVVPHTLARRHRAAGLPWARAAHLIYGVLVVLRCAPSAVVPPSI